MKLLVTGGAGFIGSNFVRHLLAKDANAKVIVLDLLTYAGNLQNLSDLSTNPRMTFIRGDIADWDVVINAVDECDAIVNFAAESHVDRSIHDVAPFIHTNVTGTLTLLEAARQKGVKRFLQISTDEVYGSLGPTGKFTEQSILAPNSPYSASKASADMLVRAYVKTHSIPAIVLRSSNAYGPFQFPEKLIPLAISNAIDGKPVPVYGDGKHIRDWVHVLDLCQAILLVLVDGKKGSIYNVGGDGELENLSVITTILNEIGAPTSLIEFVRDRPGHDRRYAMDHSKITEELEWIPSRAFDRGITETVAWYRKNSAWVEAVKSGEYAKYYERQYGRNPL